MIKHSHPYNRTVIAESRAEVPAALAWLIASQVNDTRTANAAGIRLFGKAWSTPHLNGNLELSWSPRAEFAA